MLHPPSLLTLPPPLKSINSIETCDGLCSGTMRYSKANTALFIAILEYYAPEAFQYGFNVHFGSHVGRFLLQLSSYSVCLRAN